MAWWKNLLVNFLKSSWFLQSPSIISITWKEIFLQRRVLQWQEASRRSSGSWQLSLRDRAVCTPCVLTRGQYVGSGILWGCSLYPSLASCAFCLPELSKVRPLWEILALLIILQVGSRHISRRDAVSFVCTVHPGKRVSLPKSILAFSQVFSFPFFFSLTSF